MIWLLVAGAIVGLLSVSLFFGAPYVPSQRRYIRRAFETLYPLGPNDTLVDLGSGDGIVLRIARQFGAVAVGYEIHPLLLMISRRLSQRDPMVTIRRADFWRADWPDATTVVYMFGVARDGRRLLRKMQREADRLDRPLVLLCRGNPLPDTSATASHDAYFRYDFTPAPLQRKKPQV